MRLLILTQVVDTADATLGFFHEWILAFAQKAERVTVVCLKKGDHAFPPNVSVHSLGKESGVSRIAYLLHFYSLVWKCRKDYDAVFVHMNPEYVVLGGLLWRMLGKRVGLWYTHASVTLWLRIATVLTHVVFTASPESFRLNTRKLLVTGHGIVPSTCRPRKSPTGIALISVGRISPIKNHRLMFNILEALARRGIDASLELVGAPGKLSDVQYESALRREAQTRGLKVIWRGALAHSEVGAALCEADIFLNASGTGSLDKAVLEAMAVGLPVVTSNEGLTSTFVDLDPYAVVAPQVASFADRIVRLSSRSADEREAQGARYRAFVREHHGLSSLTERIVRILTV